MREMGEVRFLSVENVRTLHEIAIKNTGIGAGGIRSEPLLESAVAMPMQQLVGVGYAHNSLEEMAAAYLYFIIANHPFIDSNKRTAVLAMSLFLRVNNYALTATKDDIIAVAVGVAHGVLQKPDLTLWVKRHIKPIQK